MGNAGSSSSKVFGGSLENHMLSSDNDIPVVLRECTRYLRREFSKCPNLFRTPASRFLVDPPSFGSRDVSDPIKWRRERSQQRSAG